MFDNYFRHLKDRLLDPLARPLRGISPIAITLLALCFGLIGTLLLTQQYYGWGLGCWWLNRMLPKA